MSDTKCQHERIKFGSGGYYIFCANPHCGMTWQCSFHDEHDKKLGKDWDCQIENAHMIFMSRERETKE